MEPIWQATNIQDKRTITGTEQEILDLDCRIWRNKKAISQVPKSHNPLLNTKPLGFVKTYLKYNRGFYCVSGVFIEPVYDHRQLQTGGA